MSYRAHMGQVFEVLAEGLAPFVDRRMAAYLDTGSGTDWIREARKWEARAKRDQAQLKTLQEQVGKLITPEQVQTTETELATTRAQLEATRLEALRLKVALQEGLPADLAARLVGEDQEALMADARTLKGLVKPTRGTPDREAGTAPSDNSTPSLTADQALRAAIGIPRKS